MAQFDQLVLTDKGKDLQNKAQTGVPLVFTRVAVGDGWLEEQELKDLIALISEKATLDISSIEVVGDGTSRVRAAIDNHELAQGYYVREIGLFADDPDEGEILYCVANAGDRADYLPAYSGSEIVESIIDLITVVGDAQQVTAIIDDSLVYATMKDLEDHNKETEVHKHQEKIFLNDPSQGKRYAFGLLDGRMYVEEVAE